MDQNELPVEAARRHLTLGRQPVPVEKRDKKPAGGDSWHLRRFTTADLDDLAAYFPPDGNIGLMVGAASGNLVDIDLDCFEAITLGRIYLPLTDMVHGRASTPFSHYWYVVDDLTDVQQFKAPRSSGGKMLVEFRCSKGERGYQTVIPPSVHKGTGEQLVWVDPEGQPAHVATADLLARVKIIAAGALLARHFPKQGQRHEFALALAGALLRYGTDEDDTYRFVYEVCRVGGSTDPAARAQVVGSTARRLADGAGDVTGIPRLIEIVGEDVAKRVCEWLDLRDVSSDAIRDLAAKIMAEPSSTNGHTNGSNGSTLFGGSASAVSDANEPDDIGPNDEINIKRTKGGDTIVCGHNVYLTLKHTSVTKNCFCFDDVDKRLVVSGKFANTDPTVLDVTVTDWLMSALDINVEKALVGDRIARLAMENKMDPIKDYLRSLKWDNDLRVEGWLTRYAGAESGSYTDFIGRKWLIATVARALDPGCKADLVLILEGEQGTRKSSLFEVLGGRWYCDLTVALSDKDAKMLNAGSWIAELPDLASLKKTSEVNAVKAFFSTRVDKFRPPYGRHIITTPRRTVYGATTNDLTYLSDVTGNRRFCCVQSGEIDLAALIKDRDQLFAEAVYLYDKHVSECEDKLECCCWWPTKEEAVQIEAEASKRIEDSVAQEIISAWWCGIAPGQRPQKILVSRVAKDALKCDPDRITRGVQMEIGHALKRLGFKRVHDLVDGQAKRIWHYVPTTHLNELPQSEGAAAIQKFTKATMKIPPTGPN